MMRQVAERREKLLRVVIAAAILFCGSAALAQGFDGVDPAGQQEASHLIVWIVRPQTGSRQRPRPVGTAQLNPAEYKEQTAGSFGQTAGSVGQPAGSSGQTMADFGQTAGSVGQTAGSTGQTAGSYRGDVTSRNAGDSGRTMGEFGVSTTDLPKAAAAANTVSLGLVPKRDTFWLGITEQTVEGFERTQVTYVDVLDDDLEALLEKAAGTDRAPDVLLGNPLPPRWARLDTGLVQRYGLLTLWRNVPIPQVEDIVLRRGLVWPEASVVARSRNPLVARQFALWAMGLGGDSTPWPEVSNSDEIATVAARALRSVLTGSMPSMDADPQMAESDAGSVAAYEQGEYQADLLNGLRLRVEKGQEYRKGSLALVTLRVVGNSSRAFGAVNAMVILRRDASDRWRVLQVTPFLTEALQVKSLQIMQSAGRDPAPLSKENDVAIGISQAAPADGDTRSTRPQLWWDNLGGAALQVVEWQQRSNDQWAYSSIYFVPDTNSRLRTQVTASFAVRQGEYRWRVWSVAKNGTMVLSGWRTLKIVQ